MVIRADVHRERLARGAEVADQPRFEVNETLSNVVENLACRVAERTGGKVTVNQLAPYLPMSLSLTKTCLDGMVDGSAVLSDERDNVTEYTFTAYEQTEPQPGPLDLDACISCGASLPARRDVLCAECGKQVNHELGRLTDKTAWPAKAVYEHEILYLGATHEGPAHAENLAGKSRYTLRNMRKKLDRLCVDGFVRQELDSDTGLITYHFGEFDYPRERFRKNMAVIRSYPASLQEEMELKVTRILISLGILVLGLLLLAFLHVPFPLLVMGLLAGAPVLWIVIWRHRSSPGED